jgi:ABC-type glycerol-3-phosphate transport system substrate-binding protein
MWKGTPIKWSLALGEQELMKSILQATSLLVSLMIASMIGGCNRTDPQSEGRIVIRYWEKWTGFEAEAMRVIVNDFNASQTRIFVNYTTVSQLDRKLMLATGGGVPPDVVGIWSRLTPAYAENNALMPLDRMAAEAGIRREDYIDVFWRICSHRDHLWALPCTPSCLALVWNKKLFREAGLDPERPPRSMAELEEFNMKLLRRRPDGGIQSIGYLPAEPDWWPAMWGYWFGGRLWDGDRTISATAPENVQAYDWIASYPRRFGAANLLNLRDGFGNFASPQNPFFTGRMAMMLQGVWIYSFIKNYAPPDFEWGVAPFPVSDPERFKDFTMVECDGLAIPAGAKHAKEGFEFIKYVNTPKVMEKLCLGQRKFTPLRESSPEFFRDHPNPYIKTFVTLAKSPNAFFVPRMTTWNEYENDMRNAFSRIWAGKVPAAQALQDVQRREQETLDRRMARWDRSAAKLLAEWNRP